MKEASNQQTILEYLLFHSLEEAKPASSICSFNSLGTMVQEFIESAKNNDNKAPHIFASTGNVLSGKTELGIKRIARLLELNIERSPNLKSNLEIIVLNWDKTEDSAAEILVNAKKERSEAKKEIRLPNYNPDFIQLAENVSRNYPAKVEEENRNIYDLLIDNIPQRYFFEDNVRVPDNVWFLRSTRALLDEIISFNIRLKDTRQSNMVMVIDVVTGHGGKSKRDYADGTFLDLSKSIKSFDGISRNDYSLWMVSSVASPSIYLGALYRHAMHQSITDKKREQLSEVFERQLPVTDQEKEYAGSGGSIQMSEEADNELISNLLAMSPRIRESSRFRLANEILTFNQQELINLASHFNSRLDSLKKVGTDQTLLDFIDDALKVGDILSIIDPEATEKMLKYAASRVLSLAYYEYLLKTINPHQVFLGVIRPNIPNIQRLKSFLKENKYLFEDS